MCGISGIVGYNWNPRDLDAMVSKQEHRGPDASNTFISGDGLVGLGHNRLSIIDLSEDGNQPLHHHKLGYHLVFNGEIYNYLELKEELKGYHFKTSTDSEVILAAYQKWGKDCVDHFNGMFAIALWDENKNELFCARDRIGIKPFYYVRHSGNFYFASEIKALIAAGHQPAINNDAVANYLINGQYERNGRTFFKEIKELEPGNILVKTKENIHIKPYWKLSDKIDDDFIVKSPKDWDQELRVLIDDAITLRLRSDVPLGVHLTGGLDSSSLLCSLGDLLPQGSRFEAFTGTYGDERYDEKVYASDVTNNLDVQINYSELDFDRFWEIAKNVQYHQDQPFGGIATMVYWEMEKLAKSKGITVLLEGQGGDELFGGYNYYVADHALDLMNAGQDVKLESFITDYCKFHQISKSKFSESLKRMIESKGKTYQDGSSYLKPNCLHPDFLDNHQITNTYEKPSKSAFTNARFRDIRHSKISRVLRFNDKMSMSASRELRVPFLDHRVVEYSFQLANDTLLQDGIPKYPLRKIMEGRLKDEIRMAPKRAVVTPQRELFRDKMKNEILEKIKHSKAAQMGILNADMMKSTFLSFCEDETQNNSFFIWQWLNLELWIETFDL